MNPIQVGDNICDRKAAHYLTDVLRLLAGDELELFDGHGTYAIARLTGSDSQWVLQATELKHSVLPAHGLTVALAAPKGERADWAVEKLTELGVRSIQWLLCARSVTRATKKQRDVRLRRIAQAAAQQCGRTTVPELRGETPLTAAVTQSASVRLVADAAGQSVLDARPHGDVHLLVGPEGGFDADELETCRRAGYSTVCLGSNTLRTETAAVAGAALLMAMLEHGNG
jgi:16S rRNA (uracil1498-N3)-methyltransferase